MRGEWPHLQGREEARHDERGLVVAQAASNIARHAEVRVLVDGARDQASHVLARAKHVWEAVREAGRRLCRRERDLANVVALGQPKDATDGAHGHQPA